MIVLNIDLVSLLVTTFLPGMFSYWYLSQIGLISHVETSDKVIFLSSISVLNILICLFFVLPILNYEINHWLKWSVVAAISFFTTFLLTWKVYPFAIDKLENLVESKLKNSKKPKIKNERVLKTILDNKPENTSNIFVYLFDLQNTFIESGYLSRFNANYGEINLSWDNNYEKYTNHFTTEDVITYSNETKNKDIFIDLDRGIKMYIFYY